MGCQRCKSERVLSASGKVSDLFGASLGRVEHQGYVPGDLGVGKGDYFEVDICLDCGQAQGKYPLPESSLDKKNIRYNSQKWVLQRDTRPGHYGDRITPVFAEFDCDDDGTPLEFRNKATSYWSDAAKFTEEEKENTCEPSGYTWVLIEDVSY